MGGQAGTQAKICKDVLYQHRHLFLGVPWLDSPRLPVPTGRCMNHTRVLARRHHTASFLFPIFFVIVVKNKSTIENIQHGLKKISDPVLSVSPIQSVD